MSDCGFCSAYDISAGDELEKLSKDQATAALQELERTVNVGDTLEVIPEGSVEKSSVATTTPSLSPSASPSLSKKPVATAIQKVLAKDTKKELMETKRRSEEANVEMEDEDGKAIPVDSLVAQVKVSMEVHAERAKDEIPKPVSQIFVDENNERDFDEGPTKLYSALMAKDWTLTMSKIELHPDQVKVWISRKEEDGKKLRWRLLPIHGAIIFGAPEYVVEALIDVYPDGAKASDDQGFLPLHLSYRMASPENIVDLLVKRYPGAMDVTDKKGRTPMALAESSKGGNRELFISVLERHATSLMARQTCEIRKHYEEELQGMKEEAESKQKELDATITALKEELNQTHETAQVLVDHIESLEVELHALGMDDKVVHTASSLEAVAVKKEEKEAVWNKEFEKYKKESSGLRTLLALEREEKEKLAEQLKSVADIQKEKEIMENLFTKQLGTLKHLEAEKAELSSAITDLTLKERAHIEANDRLAGEIAVLQKQIIEKVAQQERSVSSIESLKEIEAEKSSLRATITELKAKEQAQKEAIDSMTNKVFALQEKTTELELAAKDHELRERSQTEDHIAEVSALKKTIADMQMAAGTTESLTSEVSGLREKITELESAAKEQESQKRSQAEANVAEVAALKKVIADLQVDAVATESLTSEISALQEKITELEMTAKDQELQGRSQAEANVAEVAALKKTIADMEVATEDRRLKESAQITTNDALTEEVQTLKKTIAVMEVVVKERELRERSSNIDREAAIEELTSLKKKIINMEATREDFEVSAAKVKGLEAERDDLRRVVETLSGKLYTVAELLEGLSRQSVTFKELTVGGEEDEIEKLGVQDLVEFATEGLPTKESGEDVELDQVLTSVLSSEKSFEVVEEIESNMSCGVITEASHETASRCGESKSISEKSTKDETIEESVSEETDIVESPTDEVPMGYSKASFLKSAALKAVASVETEEEKKEEDLSDVLE